MVAFLAFFARNGENAHKLLHLIDRQMGYLRWSTPRPAPRGARRDPLFGLPSSRIPGQNPSRYVFRLVFTPRMFTW